MKKTDQGLYPVKSTTFDQVEYQRNYGAVFKPFKLFEDEEEEDIDLASLDTKKYRPPTPIENAIKESPKDLDAFCKFIKGRLRIEKGSASLSVEEQNQLVGILISELKSVWPDIRKQPPDPFLNHEENKEFHRRVAVDVALQITELFSKYIMKSKELGDLGVFSSRANISRLKTQLADEAANCLNILKMRRKVLATMGKEESRDLSSSKDSYIAMVQELVYNERGISVPKKLNTRQQASRIYRSFQIHTLKKTLETFNIEVPNLENTDLTVISEKPRVEEEKENYSRNEKEDRRKSKGRGKEYSELTRESTAEEGGVEKMSSESPYRNLKKSFSCQELIPTEDIFADFHLEDLKRKRRTSLDNLRALHETDLNADQGRPTKDNLADDLQKLVNEGEGDDAVNNEDIELDDLPPLMQVYRKSPKKEIRRKDEHVENEISEPIPSEISDENRESKNTGLMDDSPDIISSTVEKKGLTRTYNVRVSNRRFRSGLTLQSYPVVYNEFKGEVDELTIKQLDSHLFAGDELKEVYDEILGVLSKKHLDFDKDTYVEKCQDVPVPSDRPNTTLSQSRLYGNKDGINLQACPVYQPREPKLSTGPFSARSSTQQDKIARLQLKLDSQQKQEDESAKTYTSWLAWWRTAISTDDYFKYLMLQETDFLSSLFGLDELKAEYEAADNKKTKPQKEAKKEKEKRPLSDTMKQKTEYVGGYWNPNVVMLGGLGKDPDTVDVLSENVNETMVSPSNIHSKVPTSPSKSSVGMASHLSVQSTGQGHKQHISRSSSAKTSDTKLHSKPPSLQERLERIWNTLKMTDNDRLNMALKYSSDNYIEDLPKVIEKLEDISSHIAKRESTLADLEKFERIASDPNRFFEKGPRGLSSARQQEEIFRSSLNKKLQHLERKIRKEIHYLEKHYNDKINYKGRAYLHKMENDKVEMLFWLQQERRKEILVPSNSKRKEGLQTIELPSVNIESVL